MTIDALDSRVTTLEVSIHTPARGVTDPVLSIDFVYGVSIHTPARGVTKAATGAVSGVVGFNPHSRKGSDGV